MKSTISFAAALAMMLLLTLSGLPGVSLAADSAAATEQSAQSAALSPEAVAMLDRIEEYLNGITTMEARFIQTSSDGTIAEGTIKLKRPGKVRFEYDPEVPVILVSDGRALLYYDKELQQTTYLPLSETPLWFLVKEQIQLEESDLEVLDVDTEAGILRVTLTDPDNSDLAEVALDFTDSPLQLKRWRVIDAQGVTTQVSLLEPRFGVKIDSDEFDFSKLDLPKTGGTQRTR